MNVAPHGDGLGAVQQAALEDRKHGVRETRMPLRIILDTGKGSQYRLAEGPRLCAANAA